MVGWMVGLFYVCVFVGVWWFDGLCVFVGGWFGG